MRRSVATRWLLLLTLLPLISAQGASYRDYAEVLDVEPIVVTHYAPVVGTLCTEPSARPATDKLPASTIGEDIRRQQLDAGRNPHCRPLRTRKANKRILGYRVTYRYQGQTRVRRMDRDPGSILPVDVRIQPENN